ncbi:hypothetical protein F4818DRAFT_445781 [Hypoxylon cercidicola]|nr:hypothetical protein F4818DRAFT_445781 [Hypoxylon cercidicola]
MPNHPAVTVGIIAAVVAVAAAVAIYESPEVQRMANDLRRRIALALRSLGDNISPEERQNLFNRPEDAEGFLRSRGIDINELGVDADDETRRRQREELMYWNAIREEKQGKQRGDSEKMDASRPQSATRSFDDFMRQDDHAEKGTYVFHTGSDARNAEGTIRRRGDGARGLSASVYTNPFSDEHGIDEYVAFENSLMDPEKDELDNTDIYSASTQLGNKDETSQSASLSSSIPQLIKVESETPVAQADSAQPSERELGPDEYMTAGQDDRHDVFSSIQAWTQDASNASFYSPLPVSPAAPLSEPEIISVGMLTPVDSASFAGSGEDIGDDAVSARSWNDNRPYDVMSDDEGMMTPASWTEVGSVVSESEAGVARP